MKVADVMQRHVVGVQASSTLRAFADSVATHHRYAVFPVYDGACIVGTVPVWALSKVPLETGNKREWAISLTRAELDNTRHRPRRSFAPARARERAADSAGDFGRGIA